ncbi:Uncharacterised protein [Chlamydia trachomatis]|nr:Uncharacterised protein [Chlamydia trachomatis]
MQLSSLHSLNSLSLISSLHMNARNNRLCFRLGWLWSWSWGALSLSKSSLSILQISISFTQGYLSFINLMLSDFSALKHSIKCGVGNRICSSSTIFSNIIEGGSLFVLLSFISSLVYSLSSLFSSVS